MTTTIIVFIGPDNSNRTPPALAWACEQVSMDDTTDLIVSNSILPLDQSAPLLVNGARIRVQRYHPWLASSRVLSEAIDLARGEFIVIADADARLTPDALERMLTEFATDPGVGIVAPSVTRDQQGCPEFPIPPVIALRRNAIDSIGGARIFTTGAKPPEKGRGMLLEREIVAALSRSRWRWATAETVVSSPDGLTASWPAMADVIAERPLWEPREILELRQHGLNIIGLLDATCGIGDAGRRYVDAADDAEIAHATFPFNCHGSPEQPYEHHGDGRLAFDTNLIVLNASALPPLVSNVGIELLLGHYTILTPFWELEKLGPEFAAFRLVDEVWAASDFLREAFANGTDKPVIKMPLPVRRREGRPVRTRSQFAIPDGFVFLATLDFFSLAYRKNCSGVIDAFCNAFEPGEGPILVLKSLNGSNDPKGIRELHQRAGHRRDIMILDGYLDDEGMSELIGLCDCLVSLHRSEGFGLTLAEAMAWGKPVIATEYSGNLDFMTEANSYLVPFDWEQVPRNLWHIYPAGARWADPRIDVAAQTMRNVYMNPSEAERRGRRGQEDIRRTHSIEVVGRQIKERLAVIAHDRERASLLSVETALTGRR